MFLRVILTLIGWFCAVEVIINPHPVYAAFSLILLGLITACYWGLVGADFLALLLILIYLGAVLVLFLFVVMTLNQNVSQSFSWKHRVQQACVPMVAAPLITYFVSDHLPIIQQQPQNSAEDLALNLFQNYGVLIEGVGLLLLTIMIASLLILKGDVKND